MKNHYNLGLCLRPALGIVFALIVILLAEPLSAACNLQSVSLKKTNKGADLIMDFDAPDENILYDVSIHELNEVYVVTYAIDGCRSSARIPNLTEIPILHGELEAGSEETGNLVFNLYLETKITPDHRFEDDKIITSYNFVGLPLDAAPVIISSFQASSDANNSATLKFEFDPGMQGKKAFMSLDSRSAIFLFQNTGASSNDFIKPSRANFISHFKLEDGVSFNGIPYSKLVIKSKNEMFFSESQQGPYYQVELYGQGDINSAAVATSTDDGYGTTGTNQSGVDLDSYKRSQRRYENQSGAKAVLYWGLGSVAVIGGAAAGIWFLLQEDPAPLPPSTIPEPDNNLFPAD